MSLIFVNRVAAAIADSIARLGAHVAFIGAASIDVAHDERLRTLAVGLYLISFFIDHAKE